MKLLLLVVLGGACAAAADPADSARVDAASQTFEDDPELAFDPIQEDEVDEEEKELSQLDR